jgi:transposase
LPSLRLPCRGRHAKEIKLSVGPGIEVEEIELRDGRWVLSARAAGERSCPVCGKPSTSRHDWRHRRLQDLPVQGTPLVLDLRLGRWRCLNELCSRKTFVERLPSVAAPMPRRTVRVAEIVRLFGYAAGGLPSERLLARLAMPISDNAILRQLKRHVRERADTAPLRAIAIDDWSWRKGFTYGTIIVERIALRPRRLPCQQICRGGACRRHARSNPSVTM